MCLFVLFLMIDAVGVSRLRPQITCSFGGVLATNVTILNSTHLACVAPPNTAGVVDLQLQVENNIWAANTLQFTYYGKFYSNPIN
jgi:hypothetical protein